MSYARATGAHGIRSSVAGVDPYAWPSESDAFALVPALAVAYYLVVRRHPTERWRVACFVAGLLLLIAVFATPLRRRGNADETVRRSP